MSSCPELLKQALVDSFNAMDRDRSGFIDQSELEDALREYFRHGDCPQNFKEGFGDSSKLKQECEAFMKAMDINGDKKISLDEFINYFYKK